MIDLACLFQCVAWLDCYSSVLYHCWPCYA